MIYIAVHKECFLPDLAGYAPLEVGAEARSALCFLRDNDGENISSLNPNFCELTGLYWIWKNRRDEFKGLVHYRRFLGKSNVSASRKKIYSYEELEEMLQDADIVLPYTEYFKQNAREELLISCCTEEIFGHLRECVERLYPDYLVDFDAFFEDNRATLFNMMFCRRERFDDYCEFLFTILFDLQNQVNLDALNDYQKRIYGFLAERLLNVYVNHHKLVKKQVKVIHLEMPLHKRIQLIRRRITNRIYFALYGRKHKEII